MEVIASSAIYDNFFLFLLSIISQEEEVAPRRGYFSSARYLKLSKALNNVRLRRFL